MLIHPALWLMQQISKGLTNGATQYINIRCVVNAQRKDLPVPNAAPFCENILLDELKQKWDLQLRDKLTQNNCLEEFPWNIYFGINPRIDIKGNYKKHIAFFTCFYLDLDINEKWTRERRLLQIQFLKDFGFGPSIVIDSGHGFQVYWLFTKSYDKERGEVALKRMVALAGCKDGGNTFDCSRIFRLPGFLNVKNWGENDKPPCTIIWPTQDVIDSCEVVRYDPEVIAAYFPPCDMANIEDYQRRAQEFGEGDSLRENIALLTKAVAEARYQKFIAAGIIQNAIFDEAYASSKIIQGSYTSTQIEEPLLPTRGLVPALSQIKWGKNKKWMKKYCKVGLSGYNTTEADMLWHELDDPADRSPSVTDARVVYELIAQGFTYEAVKEFWNRDEVKLRREDKEEKNPNYLKITYDKMLEKWKEHDSPQARAERAKQEAPKITVDARSTIITKKGEMLTVLTGELQLLTRYIDEDATTAIDKEHFEILVKVFDAEGNPQEYVRMFPARAFASIQDFKTLACEDFLRIHVSNNETLQILLSHLLNTFVSVPVKRYNSKLMYKNKEYRFPGFIVKRDIIETKGDLALTTELAKKFPIYSWFENEILPKEQMKEFLNSHWKDLLSFHLPRVICSMMGIIAASAIRPIFEEDLKIEDFHLPCINVRGASNSGKTETVKKLLKLACISKGKNTLNTKSTQFAIGKAIELTNYIPMVIDEFKIEENNLRNIEYIRETMRQMYSGETVAKGKADLGLVTSQLHGALIVVGEHHIEREGNVSEVSRIIPVNTDEYEPDKCMRSYFNMTNARWSTFAPWFYQWILNQDHRALYTQFEALRLEVIEKISDYFSGEKLRIGHNIATVWFGCRLWDYFVQSIDPTLPTIEKTLNPEECIMKYMMDWAKSTGQVMQLKVEETKEVYAAAKAGPTVKKIMVTKAIASNEFFRMLHIFHEMIVMQDPIFTEAYNNGVFLWEDKKDNAGNLTDRIAIKIGAIHILYCEYCRKTRQIPAPKEKMFALVRAAEQRRENWIIDAKTTGRHKNNVHCVTIVSRSMLQQMNIWPENINAYISSSTNFTPNVEK